MGRNIVLLSDGTGQRGGVGYETNVWRLYQTLVHDRSQMRCYDDGVGSQDFALFKALGSAVGVGLSRNVRDLYTFLVRNYQAGDQLYLFGFSRGAFTVRLLAGLIARCGILDIHHHAIESERDLQRLIRAAYCSYRRSYFAPAFAEKFHAEYARRDVPEVVPIRFLGVWDTVDAIGVPFDEMRAAIDKVLRYSFRDLLLHPAIETACHAVSIDDPRRTFHPMMWEERLETSDRIEQTWFAGVHSNVGGGYPKCEMALVTLTWMLDRAIAAGLKVQPQALDQIKETADVHGKLYDSRRGLAAYYRYLPRDLEQIRRNYTDDLLKLHPSVLVRIKQATAGYAPHNLSENSQTSVQGTRLPANKRWRQAMQFAWDVVWLQRVLYYMLWVITVGILLLPWLSENSSAGGWCAAILEIPLAIISALTPDWAGTWIKGMQANPCGALVAISSLAGLIYLRQWLKRLQHDIASVGWGTRYPDHHACGEQLLKTMAESRWLRLARRARNSRPLQFVKNILSTLVVRLLTLVMWPFLAAGRKIHSWSCFRNTALSGFSGTMSLPRGESRTLSFVTKDYRYRTGIELVAGRRYEIVVESAGWFDAHVEATPEGLRPGPDADRAERLARRWAKPRIPGEPLFALMAQIGKGTPVKVGKGRELVPEQTGELALFVNDAVVRVPGLRNVFYCNNRGVARIRVRHLA